MASSQTPFYLTNQSNVLLTVSSPSLSTSTQAGSSDTNYTYLVLFYVGAGQKYIFTGARIKGIWQPSGTRVIRASLFDASIDGTVWSFYPYPIPPGGSVTGSSVTIPYTSTNTNDLDLPFTSPITIENTTGQTKILALGVQTVSNSGSGTISWRQKTTTGEQPSNIYSTNSGDLYSEPEDPQYNVVGSFAKAPHLALLGDIRPTSGPTLASAIQNNLTLTFPWSKTVAGEVRYVINQTSTPPAISPVNYSSSAGTANSGTITSGTLSPGQTYYLHAYIVNDAGSGPASSRSAVAAGIPTISDMTVTQVTDAPQTLNNFKFSVIFDSQGSTVTLLSLCKNDGTVLQTYSNPISGTEYSYASTWNQEITFAAKVTNSIGTSTLFNDGQPFTVPAQPVVPNQVTNLTLSRVNFDPSSATIQWSESTGNAYPVTEYRVYRKPLTFAELTWNAGTSRWDFPTVTTGWIQIKNPNTDTYIFPFATSYTIGDHSAYTPYVYRVTAVNEIGENSGAVSNVITDGGRYGVRQSNGTYSYYYPSQIGSINPSRIYRYTGKGSNNLTDPTGWEPTPN